MTKKNFKVEMEVESGLGYRLADETNTSLVGQINVDALFSPVVTVAYKVEATRVGRQTDYDRLLLDVKTKGSITPLEAVKRASEILAKQFSQIFNPQEGAKRRVRFRLSARLRTLWSMIACSGGISCHRDSSAEAQSGWTLSPAILA